MTPTLLDIGVMEIRKELGTCYERSEISGKEKVFFRVNRNNRLALVLSDNPDAPDE